ncbi:DUF4831 family protein [Porphyromonas macacae]|nr:DUF4831 family protein [Porphyromonas macacae]
MNIRRSFWAVMMLGIALNSLAQTNIIRYDANKSNDFGIIYNLPKTQIIVEAIVDREIYTPGILSDYALKYLNQRVKLEPSESYRLSGLRVRSAGIPDKEHQYVIEFRPGTVAPYVTLTTAGIINGINSKAKPQEEAPIEGLGKRSGTRKQQPSLPQEYNMAGSVSKQAEIAAQYLFHVRESSINIVTGDVDQMPKDGQAMKIVMDRLKQEELATLALFTGDTIRERSVYRVTIDPAAPIQNRIIFRFSEQLGALDADNLAGAPVRLDLSIIDKAPELSPKEQEKYLRNLKGIVYNMPGIGLVKIDYEGKTLFKGQVYVTQWGTKQCLAPKMFKDRNDSSPSILFDINTGGIVSIKGPDGNNL